MSELLGLPLDQALFRLAGTPYDVVTCKNRFREDTVPDSLRVIRVQEKPDGHIQLTVAEFYTASQS